MKLTLVTDAWKPQVNGVVRTWSQVMLETEKLGHAWRVIHPGLFRTLAAPKYPEIKLALFPGRRVAQLLDAQQPDAIHIATEGPLGAAARRYCLRRRLPFTTSYHTQFPLYLKQYFRVPTAWSYRFMRRFHAPARATLVPTASLTRELEHHNFRNLITWTRGVDTHLFHPTPRAERSEAPDSPKLFHHLPRPIFLYAGRVAAEKNIEAFLALDLPGGKVVVGDGPIRAALQRKYPDVHFAGYRFGEDLVAHYAAADVFVFPSKTDTFGVVLLEAGACGLPVAAYPVTGPIDVVAPGRSGCLDKDLRAACLGALRLSRDAAVQHARHFTWQRCADIALKHFAPIHRTSAAPLIPLHAEGCLRP